MHTRRNTPTIICDRDGVICMNYEVYIRTIARQMLVDRVINNFPYQVVEPLGIGTADIHAGPFAYGFESFKCRNITGIVFRRVGSNVLSLFHIIHEIKLAKK